MVFGVRVDGDGVCRVVGDSWREVGDPPFALLNRHEAFVEGAVYSLPDGLLARGRCFCCARFDLEQEEWYVIPLDVAFSSVVRSLTSFDGIDITEEMTPEAGDCFDIGYPAESCVSFHSNQAASTESR